MTGKKVTKTNLTSHIQELLPNETKKHCTEIATSLLETYNIFQQPDKYSDPMTSPISYVQINTYWKHNKTDQIKRIVDIFTEPRLNLETGVTTWLPSEFLVEVAMTNAQETVDAEKFHRTHHQIEYSIRE